MVEESFLQLGPDGFELLEGGLLSHGGRSGGLEGGGGVDKGAMGITYTRIRKRRRRRSRNKKHLAATVIRRIRVAGRGEKRANNIVLPALGEKVLLVRLYEFGERETAPLHWLPREPAQLRDGKNCQMTETDGGPLMALSLLWGAVSGSSTENRRACMYGHAVLLYLGPQW